MALHFCWHCTADAVHFLYCAFLMTNPSGPGRVVKLLTAHQSGDRSGGFLDFGRCFLPAMFGGMDHAVA